MNGLWKFVTVHSISDPEALEAARNISDRGLSVYCLSTCLFNEDIERGEQAFRENHLNRIHRIIELAGILKPQIIRLLAARSGKRTEFLNIIPHIKKKHPWLIPMYRDAINQIHVAGFGATIENEAHDCIFSRQEYIACNELSACRH